MVNLIPSSPFPTIVEQYTNLQVKKNDCREVRILLLRKWLKIELYITLSRPLLKLGSKLIGLQYFNLFFYSYICFFSSFWKFSFSHRFFKNYSQRYSNCFITNMYHFYRDAATSVCVCFFYFKNFIVKEILFSLKLVDTLGN